MFTTRRLDTKCECFAGGKVEGFLCMWVWKFKIVCISVFVSGGGWFFGDLVRISKKGWEFGIIDGNFGGSFKY